MTEQHTVLKRSLKYMIVFRMMECRKHISLIVYNIHVIHRFLPIFLTKALLPFFPSQYHHRVFGWGTWGCGVSKFPWTYDQNESCYLLAGKVTVTPDDKSLKPATFGKGDFVTFPAGMSCTWDVSEAVNKHFNFF